METITRLFVHSVDLEGEKGITSRVEGLFNDGTLVNSICSNTFASLHDKLGPLVPSSKILKMVDGTHVFSDGHWCGNVSLGEHIVKACFEVFGSRGGQSLLFGKPLLKQFKAVHDYGNDTLMIPLNGSWTMLLNECEGIPVRGVSQSNNDDVLRGDAEPPSRQVSLSYPVNLEQVDKQNSVGTPTKIADDMIAALKTKGKHGRGRRNRRNRQKLRENEASPSWVQQCWNAIWTISDGDSEPIEPLGDLQPELEIGNDHSLFIRASDPHNPQRIEEILKQVAIGPNLSDEERSKVHNLISEFADCFALSVREVLPVPGAEHRIHIPPDVIFPKKIPYQ
jgi:hypothetical protein